MSRQLAFSACLSILAMAGLALAAPAIADHSAAHSRAAASETAVHASLLSVQN